MSHKILLFIESAGSVRSFNSSYEVAITVLLCFISRDSCGSRCLCWQLGNYHDVMMMVIMLQRLYIDRSQIWRWR